MANFVFVIDSPLKRYIKSQGFVVNRLRVRLEAICIIVNSIIDRGDMCDPLNPSIVVASLEFANVFGIQVFMRDDLSSMISKQVVHVSSDVLNQPFVQPNLARYDIMRLSSGTPLSKRARPNRGDGIKYMPLVRFRNLIGRSNPLRAYGYNKWLTAFRGYLRRNAASMTTPEYPDLYICNDKLSDIINLNVFTSTQIRYVTWTMLSEA